MRSAEEVLEPRSTSMATFPHINRRALRLSCTDSDNNKNTTNSRHRRSSSDNAHPPHTAPIWCDNRQHTHGPIDFAALSTIREHLRSHWLPCSAVISRNATQCVGLRLAGWLEAWPQSVYWTVVDWLVDSIFAHRLLTICGSAQNSTEFHVPRINRSVKTHTKAQ